MKRMSAKHAPVAELVQIDAESRRGRLARRTPLSDADDLASTDARLETQCSFHAEHDARGTQNQDRDPHTANETAGAISEEQQKTLLDFDSHERKIGTSAIRIVADQREARSGVIEELEALGAIVDRRTLPVADYVMSDRVAVERKTDRDFTASLTGRDLLAQIQELATNYERPLIVIEGPDLFTQTDVHPNAIRGMLAAITVDLGVPIIGSRDAAETARLLFAIAEREQLEKKRTPKVHGKKILKTFQEQQEYVIAAIPSIGPLLPAPCWNISAPLKPFFARRLKSSRRCEASANRPHRRFANSHRHITRPARSSFGARITASNSAFSFVVARPKKHKCMRRILSSGEPQSSRLKDGMLRPRKIDQQQRLHKASERAYARAKCARSLQ